MELMKPLFSMVLYPFPPVAPRSSSLPSAPWSALLWQPSAHAVASLEDCMSTLAGQLLLSSVCNKWQDRIPLSIPLPFSEWKFVIELLRASQVHL